MGISCITERDPAGLAACEAAADELTAGSAELTELFWGFGPLTTLALAALYTERFADAEHAFAAALGPADRVGAPGATAVYLLGKAVLATRQGRLSDALALAHQASAAAELMPYPYIEANAGFRRAEILLLMGRLTECADWCQRAEAIAASRGQSYLRMQLSHVRAQLHHYAGEHVEACAMYGRIEELTIRLGIAEPCPVAWGRHALISYLAIDRPDDARRVIDWLDRCAARLPCRWPRIAAATGRAMLAEADGDLETAEAHHQAALVLHEQVELPLEHVETLLGYGTFLRRHGQRVRARPHLVHALEIAENCGASWLADQARGELAIAGGRRGRAREDPTRLTAQELRVARLAAGGHSNKAIAAQLSLSSKTIEYHLAQVYLKLGINSRRQLMTGHHNL